MTDNESILFLSGPMRCWWKPKPGQTKIGSHLGRIALSERRFMFLSTGGAGWDESIGRLAVGGVVGLAAGLATAGYTARDLDLSALETEGSFEQAVDGAFVCEARRSGLVWFLGLEEPAGDGETRPIAIAPEAMFKKATVQDIAARVQTIRDDVAEAGRDR